MVNVGTIISSFFLIPNADIEISKVAVHDCYAMFPLK